MEHKFFGSFGNRLEAENAAALQCHLEKLDVDVPKRTEGRTSAHMERYALVLYLRSMLQEDRLAFPLLITKREKPDFHWQEPDHNHGLEVVSAASQGYQKAFTELEKAPKGSQLHAGDYLQSRTYKIRKPGDTRGVPGIAGDKPEREWTQDLLARIQQKTEKLQGYDVELRENCDLLIYDNTEWSAFIGWYADELPSRLTRAFNEWRSTSDPDWIHYRRISVVRDQIIRHNIPRRGLLVLHDITQEAGIFVSSLAATQLEISHRQIARFCEHHGIRKLGFFGSIHEPERFGPDSDVDVLIEFQPDERVGLIRLAGIEIELSDLVGRQVDLRSVPDLSRYFREEVTRQKTELEYVARAS